VTLPGRSRALRMYSMPSSSRAAMVLALAMPRSPADILDKVEVGVAVYGHLAHKHAQVLKQ
jgi:hypothetical protein